MRSLMLPGLIAAAALVAPVYAQQQPEVTLREGDPAPVLEHVEWIKGEPVTEFIEGDIYVLDFWATWCPPCVAAIPHINKLQQRHKDDNVHVIAVAIWGSQNNEEFVEARGDAMDYRVAVDIDDLTAEAYMKAAGQGGIPTVMVVDGEGDIAWIGRPDDELDLAVNLMVEGEFTPERMKEERARILEEKRVRDLRTNELTNAGWEALRASDWPAVEEAFAELVDLQPILQRQVAPFIYVARAAQGKAEEARALADELLKGDLRKDADFLSSFAWMIVSPDQTAIPKEQTDAALAIDLASRAADLTKRKVADTLDTLARAHFVAGDLDAAIATQEEAVNAAASDDERVLMQGRLDGYLDVRDAS